MSSTAIRFQTLTRRAHAPTTAFTAFDPVRWIAAAGISAASIGFAMANGMQYGRSNHWQYLLHGLHAADPGFLRNDWFTTRTAAHHRLFNSLVEFAASTGQPDVVLGVLNGVCAVGFAISLYFLVARFSRRPLLPFAVALVLAAGVPINGLGGSNILLPYLVPSVFSGVALLAAATCLLYSRDVAAGLLAAAAGAVHGNFLLLIGPLWILVLVLDRPRRSIRRAGWLLAPWAAAWIPHLPYFVAMARDAAPGGEARRIFWDVYAPFHYRPLTWAWRAYADFGLFVTGGAVAALIGRVRFGRKARSIAGAFALVLVMGAIGTIGWPSDVVTALFTWRLAPFVIVFSLVAMALSVTGDWGTPVRRLGLAALLAIVLRLARMPNAACLSLIAAAAISVLLEERGNWNPIRRMRIPIAIGITVTFLVAAVLARYGLWRRDMFGKSYKPEEASLFSWCRQNTDVDSVFIIPPNLAPFRLEARRAILADWKCMPLLPHDQLEWMRRQERLAGRAVSGEADAIEGYSAMDETRALVLAREYACNYLVVDKNLGGAQLKSLRQLYSNGRFDVYELDSRVATIRR